MNLKLAQLTNQRAYQPVNFQPQTRAEKKADFVSSAIPNAIMGGLGGLSAAGGAGALSSVGSLSGAGAGIASAGASSVGGMSGVAGAAGAAGAATGIIGGLWGAAQLAMNWGKSSPAAGSSSGMAVGAMIGTLCCPGIGTAIGAGIGAIAGGLIGAITSGKHKDQKVRDQVRSGLIEMGIINSEYQLPLADGTMYDMGKDGGPRAEYGGRRPYEMDVNDPVVQHTANWIEPIMAVLFPGNQKVRVDFTGYFTNAAMSNAKDMNGVLQNVESFVARFGLTNETLANAVVQMAQAGMVEPQKAEAWLGGIKHRMSLTAPQQDRGTRRRESADDNR